MKHLSIFVLGALLCAGLVGCQEDSQSISSSDPSFGAKGGASATPSPEIVYWRYDYIKGKSLPCLGVCDSTGSHATNVLAFAQGTNFWGQPTWSPDGGSVAFIDGGSNRDACALKTMTVGVSAGKVVGGTPQTIRSVSVANDKKVMAGGIWSPTNDEIVYSLQDRTGDSKLNVVTHIYAIPAGGGASDLVYQTAPGGSVYHMTWNADGTKLAVLEWEVDQNDSTQIDHIIRVIDRANGTVDKSIDASTFGFSATSLIDLAWARAGSSILAFANAVGSAVSVYTTDLSSANPSATLVSSDARYPSWSPTNYKMVYRVWGSGSPNMSGRVMHTGTTSVLLDGQIYNPFWKP